MIAVAVAAAALAWIRWAQGPRPFVSGVVICNGEPVNGGEIVFVSPNPAGQQAAARIIHGKYSVTGWYLDDDAMSGTYDVAVVSAEVPVKYRSRATSGLRVQVDGKATNPMEFELR